MRVCTHVTTGALIEAQDYATPGTLISNNLSRYLASEMREKEVTRAEFRELLRALTPNADVQAQIVALEDTVTNRRLREAVLTGAGKAWLNDVDAQIAALRANLIA